MKIALVILFLVFLHSSVLAVADKNAALPVLGSQSFAELQNSDGLKNLNDFQQQLTGLQGLGDLQDLGALQEKLKGMKDLQGLGNLQDPGALQEQLKGMGDLQNFGALQEQLKGIKNFQDLGDLQNLGDLQKQLKDLQGLQNPDKLPPSSALKNNASTKKLEDMLNSIQQQFKESELQ